MSRSGRNLLEDVPAVSSLFQLKLNLNWVSIQNQAGLSVPKDSNECVIVREDDVDDQHFDHSNEHIRYGSIPKKIQDSDPLNRQPFSELAEYFHTQKESIYRRSRREPLGKPYSHGTQFPKNIAENPNFAFGKKSDSVSHLSTSIPITKFINLLCDQVQSQATMKFWINGIGKRIQRGLNKRRMSRKRVNLLEL